MNKDDINVSTKPNYLQPFDRMRSTSESGGALSPLSRSKGSQLNLERKNSVIGASSIIPTLDPSFDIDDDRKSLDEEVGLDDKEELDEEQKKLDKLEQRKYMKNLLVLCLGFFFIFTAFLSLRNLQSSLNAVAGLGMYALSCTYFFFFIGCIFATTIVQRLGPKKSVVIMSFGLLMYDFAYFYPLFYTMVPAAGLAGFSQGVIWTAHATYIANIAACYANLSGEKIANVLSKFNGIFFVFYQSCQIVGGIVASLILKSPEAPALGTASLNGTTFNCSEFMWHTNSSVEFMGEFSANFSLVDSVAQISELCNSSSSGYMPNKDYSTCGRGYCHYKAVKSEIPVEKVLVFILVGVFTACTITGQLILFFFLDPLNGQMQMKKSQGKLLQQLSAVFRFYANRKAICMVGIMFYSLLQAAFMFGEYNKAFVTCTIGIQYVGYIMMTHSFSSAIAAFWNGRIQKYSGRWPLLFTAFACQGMVFMTLLLWSPSPDNMAVFFVLVVFWGIGDGTIMTQDISLIGLLFSDNKEPAFAALKMTQSMANFTFFIAGPYMCTIHKMYYVFSILCLAAIGYFVLELIMHHEARQKKRQMITSQSNGDTKALAS